MAMRYILPLTGLLFAGGCLYQVREQTDRKVCEMAGHAFDVTQPSELQPTPPALKGSGPSATNNGKPTDKLNSLLIGTDVRTAALMEGKSERDTNVDIPEEIPGSEAKRIGPWPENRLERERAIEMLYPKLDALPEELKALPGPGGQPYTLAILQDIAAHNSPGLAEAAAAIESARGNLIAAGAYPNPTISFQNLPSNDGSQAGVRGIGIDQLLKTGGKLRLSVAAAEEDYRNAELAFKRARSNLSTQVRTAYYALLVARESMHINRAMAVFTDNMFRLHVESQVKGTGFAAAYEPAAMRAQAYTMRMTYQQSMDTYAMAWKQLVAAVGLRQLPLSEVAGRVDRAIPYFDYDEVLLHILQQHTDVLTARNGIDKARYNLKLAQVTPWSPDVDVSLVVQKEFAVAPQLATYSLSIGVPVPIWDRNRGPIMSAEAALLQAQEEPHRAELALTNNLSTAYQTYKTNLDALEKYRRYILPDQVRAYRGVIERRQVQPEWSASNFNDLLSSQATLTTSVTAYLGILSQLWTSAIQVADLLQTDDLFELAQPLTLPPLPDLDEVCPWPCPHPCGVEGGKPCPCEAERAGACTSHTP
jgi:cobalt-zinc-cadmium efflux system outer membrane protein